VGGRALVLRRCLVDARNLHAEHRVPLGIDDQNLDRGLLLLLERALLVGAAVGLVTGLRLLFRHVQSMSWVRKPIFEPPVSLLLLRMRRACSSWTSKSKPRSNSMSRKVSMSASSWTP